MTFLRKTTLTLAVVTTGLVALSGCQSLDSNTSGSAEDTVTVGFISPLTGPVAVFGANDEFVVDEMRKYFADNPIKVGDKTFKVEILQEDSQSDPTRAGQVAQDLITNKDVDVLMAHGTPEVTNPVANQCEANGVPCITADTPWQPYFFGRNGDPENPFKWTYHFFWGLEDIAAVYQDQWDQIDTNKKVAGLFPNDSDGTAWSQALPDMFKEGGYELNNPGLFEPGTQDFSAQIAAFKANGDEILTGVLTPGDFATFWQQAQQQGFQPRLITLGKAVEFPAAIDAIGSSAVNIGTEVWWSPDSPFSSSLTGQSSRELADAYEAATGKQWSMPLGFPHALFEVLNQTVIDAGGTDGEAMVKALSTMKIDTIVGPLDWTSGPVPNVAKTPLVAGQWRKATEGDFPFMLEIVANSLAPEVPVTGSVKEMKY